MPSVVDDRPLPVVETAVASHEARPAGTGQEAEVLGIGLGGDRQAGGRGELAHLRLVQLAERKPHPRQRRRCQRREHVGLVLGRVGGCPQQRPALIAGLRQAGVVAGRELLRPQPLAEFQHRVEPHVAVAADARIGSLAVRVAGDERFDDAGPELVAQVDREVREAHRMRQRPRLGDGRRRAAAALRVVLGVRPQLERDRDRIALGGDQVGGDGAVDAAAHRDQRPAAGRLSEIPASADRGPERARQRVGRQLGRVQLAWAEAAELSGDLLWPDQGRLEDARAADERHRGAPSALLLRRIRWRRSPRRGRGRRRR